MLRWIVSLAVVLALSGCGTMFQSEVSAFHQLSKPDGLTFVMVPYKEQQGSLEHDTYARSVAAALTRQGMREVSDQDQAAVAVFIRYGIDGGKQVVSSYPIIGQTGVASSNTYGTVSGYGNMASLNATTTYTPTYGVVGSGTRTDTVYQRFFDMDILEMSSLSPNATPRKLYEAKVRSSGSTGQLSAVMPYMVESLFKDFPGTSGKARTVTLQAK